MEILRDCSSPIEGPWRPAKKMTTLVEGMLYGAMIGLIVGLFISSIIVENTVVQVTFFEGHAVSIDLPGSVELKVEHTDPGIKGDSVSNVFKPATLETGLQIKVPNHINTGDVVKVSTLTGEFQGRATS